MWIHLNNSFLSIVEHKDNAAFLLVRARRKGDIERVFPRAKVTYTPKADYLYRAKLQRDYVAEVIASRVLQTNYTNFKDSIRDQAYHDVCMLNWINMYNYQHFVEDQDAKEEI